MAVGSIAARCLKKQKAEQREILASKIAAITNEKTIEVISDAGSSFDLMAFNASNKLMQVCKDKAEWRNLKSHPAA